MVKIASTVYDTLELELQDGTEVVLRPLPIKRLRLATNTLASFSKRAASGEFDEMPETEANDIFIDTLVKVVAITLEKKHRDIIDDLEDILDIPTMYKIVEIATGWKFNQDDDELGKVLATVGEN
jgi:hypothetical protein